MSSHNPLRPAWTCGGCGDRWPCKTRRLELLAEYDGIPAAFGVYMRDQLAVARYDLLDEDYDVLAVRFLGWTGAAI